MGLVAQALAHGLQRVVHGRASGGRSRPANAASPAAACPVWLQGAPGWPRPAGRRPALPRCAPRRASRPEGGISLPTGDRVSTYSTMTRESNTASPPSSTRQGTLPSGLLFSDGVLVPDVFQHELVVELLLGHHHTHLAHVGAGQGSRSVSCLVLCGWHVASEGVSQTSLPRVRTILATHRQAAVGAPLSREIHEWRAARQRQLRLGAGAMSRQHRAAAHHQQALRAQAHRFFGAAGLQQNEVGRGSPASRP